MELKYGLFLLCIIMIIVKYKEKLGLKIITFVTYIENRKFYKLMDSMVVSQTHCEDTNDAMKKCIHVNVGSLSHFANKNDKALEIV